MKTEKIVNVLRQLGACSAALNWVQESGCTSVPELWRKCERSDWLLWIADRLGGSVVHRAAVLRANRPYSYIICPHALHEALPVPTYACLEMQVRFNTECRREHNAWMKGLKGAPPRLERVWVLA